MSTIHSEIEQWVRLAKGDLPGHAFHGNQWSSIGDKISELAYRSGALHGLSNHLVNSKAYKTAGRMEEKGTRHGALAEEHRKIAQGLNKLSLKVSEKLGVQHPLVKALDKAERAHDLAAKEHEHFADIEGFSSSEAPKALSKSAHELTDQALTEHYYHTAPNGDYAE